MKKLIGVVLGLLIVSCSEGNPHLQLKAVIPAQTKPGEMVTLVTEITDRTFDCSNCQVFIDSQDLAAAALSYSEAPPVDLNPHLAAALKSTDKSTPNLFSKIKGPRNYISFLPPTCPADNKNCSVTVHVEKVFPSKLKIVSNELTLQLGNAANPDVIPGTEGGACISGSCSAGLVCNVISNICQSPQPGNVGGACQAGNKCDFGLTCDTTNNKCKATDGAVGGKCKAGGVCDQGQCNLSTNICTPSPGQNFGPCRSDANNKCDAGLQCDDTAHICVSLPHGCVPVCDSHGTCASISCGAGFICNTQQNICQPEVNCNPACTAGFTCDKLVGQCSMAGAVCGNGNKEGTEQCDDGNQIDTDNCKNDCSGPGNIQQSICGNGIKEGNEQCDDGNQIDTDACKNDCSGSGIVAQPVCGNGNKEGNEQCDDGNQVDTDNCKNNCTLPGVVGNTNPEGTLDGKCKQDGSCNISDLMCDTNTNTCSLAQDVACKAGCPTDQVCNIAQATCEPKKELIILSRVQKEITFFGSTGNVDTTYMLNRDTAGNWNWTDDNTNGLLVLASDPVGLFNQTNDKVEAFMVGKGDPYIDKKLMSFTLNTTQAPLKWENSDSPQVIDTYQLTGTPVVLQHSSGSIYAFARNTDGYLVGYRWDPETDANLHKDITKITNTNSHAFKTSIKVASFTGIGTFAPSYTGMAAIENPTNHHIEVFVHTVNRDALINYSLPAPGQQGTASAIRIGNVSLESAPQVTLNGTKVEIYAAGNPLPTGTNLAIGSNKPLSLFKWSYNGSWGNSITIKYPQTIGSEEYTDYTAYDGQQVELIQDFRETDYSSFNSLAAFVKDKKTELAGDNQREGGLKIYMSDPTNPTTVQTFQKGITALTKNKLAGVQTSRGTEVFGLAQCTQGNSCSHVLLDFNLKNNTVKDYGLSANNLTLLGNPNIVLLALPPSAAPSTGGARDAATLGDTSQFILKNPLDALVNPQSQLYDPILDTKSQFQQIVSQPADLANQLTQSNPAQMATTPDPTQSITLDSPNMAVTPEPDQQAAMPVQNLDQSQTQAAASPGPGVDLNINSGAATEPATSQQTTQQSTQQTTQGTSSPAGTFKLNNFFFGHP